jgi:hypothetical protein
VGVLVLLWFNVTSLYGRDSRDASLLQSILYQLPCGDLVELLLILLSMALALVPLLYSRSDCRRPDVVALVASRRPCYSRPSSGRLVSDCLAACTSLAIVFASNLSKESSSC